ncbi:MAG: deoxyguanosinetriphosphate triphosphohydrolase [Candidatus Dadabacteria bacterium]|nr:deoxyguanosinetriphosphate triphosphohydrolase [Candidatus Dadabacteria bacterium]NIV41004.1 deoxyguanosinetriphosphate triphosphohydrolase [Candidatus Dadabacteria bacterium]NIX15911.1 deoxyguanosinetriphosphate triphosphohydrolase [Candidatus Dadabacteria bacterium]
MNIRKRTEEIERQTLSAHAMLSAESKGRHKAERPCTIRTCFQRDRDRIIHSKSFRRLKHKTQVFLAPTSDHYRTRLTHVIEVSQIARTIARSLRLNEDLTEAIALGHDLGHTPFGHAGEQVLNEIHPGGFKHVIHSLRVVDVLEKDGKGLNLTHEVRDGIAKHSKGMGSIDNPKYRPETMEGQVVRVSDLVAYANHDLDDALRSGIIKLTDVPKQAINVLGRTISKRVNSMVTDIITQTQDASDGVVHIGEEVEDAIVNLRSYLFENVYMNEAVKYNFVKAGKIIRELYEYFCTNPEKLWELKEKKYVYDKDHNQIVCDFIAGMTDSFAISLYEKLFLPKRWSVEFSK